MLQMSIKGGAGSAGRPSTARRVEPVDVLVGRRVRALRLSQGMSQPALGEKIGVTFQQIQKYEKGTNRIGSSRLKKIAAVFGVGIATLFPEDEGAGDKSVPDALIEMLCQPHAARLLTAFYAIRGAKERLALVQLAESLARQSRRA